MNLKIAMTDMDIIWENKEANQKLCQSMMREAAERESDLILFPEMTLTGFSMDVERICDREEETVSFFSEQAEKYHLAAGFGYVDKDADGMGKNHFCLVDKEGTVQMDYIKIHPFTYGGEADYYRGGDRLASFHFGGWTAGAFICYDLRFAEAFAKLPLDTDVIFVIANWPEERLHHWYALLRARALEMQCYVVGVNRVGEGGGLQYAKSSAAFDADGNRVPEEKGERNRYILLDLAARRNYAKNFPVRKDRRPDLYF